MNGTKRIVLMRTFVPDNIHVYCNTTKENSHFSSYILVTYLLLSLLLLDVFVLYILETLSNFTLLTTEYIFTVFDFNQLKCCNKLLIPAQTLFTKRTLEKIIFFRVCLFFCLFVFVALRPMSTAMVIAGRSVHLTTLFPGQA